MAKFGQKRHIFYKFLRQNPAKFDAKSFAEWGLIGEKNHKGSYLAMLIAERVLIFRDWNPKVS